MKHVRKLWFVVAAVVAFVFAFAIVPVSSATEETGTGAIPQVNKKSSHPKKSAGKKKHKKRRHSRNSSRKHARK
jgi:hypothetical protein